MRKTFLVCCFLLALLSITNWVVSEDKSPEKNTLNDHVVIYECQRIKEKGGSVKTAVSKLYLNKDTLRIKIEFVGESGKKYITESFATRYNDQMFQVFFVEPGTHWDHVFDFNSNTLLLGHRGKTVTAYYSELGSYQCKRIDP